MARLTSNGCVVARCPGCYGGESTFEWERREPQRRVKLGPKERNMPESYGGVTQITHEEGPSGPVEEVLYLVMRCAGCGRGGLAEILIRQGEGLQFYPHCIEGLINFYPEVAARLKVPDQVPHGIKAEFEEAEKCLDNGCLRASAGMFRSVLDKTMRANGYKIARESLNQQIEMAAADGVITESRKRKAHDDIRVLGNDVLHEEWQPIEREAVEAARHYAQRILEDFYDDRPTILGLLRSKGRVPDEDKGDK